MRLKLLVLPVLALGALLGVNTIAQAAPATITVNVGGGGSGVAANDFFPDSLSLHQGDTIHFTNPYEELHTTTYVPPATDQPALIIPNPLGGPGQVFNPVAENPTHPAPGAATFAPGSYFNSGFMFKGGSADVTFPDGGTFKFLCLLHPGMELSVSVVGAAETTADTQAQITARGKEQLDAMIADGSAVAASVPLSRSGNTWNLQVGGGLGQADIMQFLPPQTLKISVGDSVKWTAVTATPHTVTFGAQPPLLTQIPNPSGNPPAYDTFSPAALLPSGGSSYAGGNANSGIIDSASSFPGGSSYTLTFTKAGTYTYVCLLHADQGMAGVVQVGEVAGAAAPPPAGRPSSGITAPNTGHGEPQSSGSAWAIALALMGLAGGAVVLGGVRALWRPLP